MEIVFLSGSALWLGILTSLSPCTLATNVAAVTFLSKRISHPAVVCLSGVAYTLGRVFSYTVLGWILIHSLLSVPQVAQFLQQYLSQALGPLLVVTGLILLGWIKVRFPRFVLAEARQRSLAEAGAPGAFLLGTVFSLAFCPFSAALFFGSLIPLALKSRAGAILPFVYGVGTGLPVLFFAVVIALGVASLGRWFEAVKRLECYTRVLTGAVFFLVGLYYTVIAVLRWF